MAQSQRFPGKFSADHAIVTPVIMVVAVLAIASSAILVRWAAAPAVALAFWRTFGGALILTPKALSESRSARLRADRVIPWKQVVVAGLALAAHFASWLASLEMTTVAASVTLVSTGPLMIAGWQTIGGQRPSRATTGALLLATAGTGLIAAGDLGLGQAFTLSRTALIGDGLALVGALSMAVYLIVGAKARQVLPTASYAARAYGVAALSLLIGAGLAMMAGHRIPLTGFDRTTWAVIAAMTLGPQILGHTSLNLLLERLGPLPVGLALLTEPVAATALAWLVLGEIPPLLTVAGSALVVGALLIRLVLDSDETSSKERQ